MSDGTATFLARLDSRAATVGAALVIAVVASGGFLGVRAGQGQAAGDRAPATVKLDPANGRKDVPPDRPLVFTASRPLPAQALASALELSPAAAGDLTASPDGRTFTWRAREPLADLTEYTVRVRSGAGAGGHPLAGGPWRFRTALLPRVVALAADPGDAPLQDQAEVPLGTGLKVTFNAGMDSTATQVLANGRPVVLTWSEDRRSASLDRSALRAGSLRLQLAPGARDAAGRPARAWQLDAKLVFRPAVRTVPLRAPALVQIGNDPAARDQSGLQAADVVYEYLTEGGITRLTAVFSSAPDAVGPIQSGRLISLKLARHHRGMLFMSDLSRGSTAKLNAEPLPSSLDVPDAIHRTGERPPPNNLYATSASIQQAEERKGLAPVEARAGEVAIGGGEPATQVAVPEHRSTYSYDADSGTYVKTEDGRPLVDAALAQPVRVSLLLVLHTSATPTPYAEDPRGRRGLDFDLDSGGRADLYYGGLHAAGRWAAPDRAGPLRFTVDGSGPLDLPSGLTWVDVVT